MIISTADALIDALGGNRALGGHFGVAENTVSTWRVRGVPAWARDELREMAIAASIKCDPAIFEIRRRARNDPAAQAGAA